VLGLALVAMREEIGRQMLPRTFDHLMQYGDPAVRRSVPLAMGLLNLCDPDLTVMDTLSKFSHDHDAEVAMAAILGLGLIGAGTNNARIAGLLRSLAQYYAKELGQLFVVRLAQGFLHLGKGTITLQPYHSDRLLMRPAALGGILAALHTMLDVRGLVLGRAHYLLYSVALAMQPRCIITLNADLEPLQTNIRVGTAIDVVGKAGSPKAITGFQTHTSPVLIGTAERAELATEEHLTLTPVLEGPVILLPNPDYKPKVKK
jgi:26S proteasome regulatory subunit N1